MRLKNPLAKEDSYQQAIFWLLLATLVSLAFSVRIVNSLSIMMLVVVTVMHPERRVFIKRAFTNPYFICCLLLFVIRGVGYFYSEHQAETLKQLGGKVIWLAIPFFFCANSKVGLKAMQQLMVFFSASLLIVAIWCLVKALSNYTVAHDSSVFFYHDLVRPFKHHAVFFSFYLFFCIVYWMEEGVPTLKSKHRIVVLILITFFLCFIFLLSSKLVIIVSCLYLFYFSVRSVFVKKAKGLLLILLIITGAAISLVLTTNNPVRNRFSDAISGSSSLFTQEKFSPSTYFNGVQLRLLIWRFTYEILTEKKSWLLGVSSGDAQYELNRKYAETNVYQGNGVSDTQGYKAFNCHNVFLQTTLESGLLALLALIMLIWAFLWQAFRKKKRFAIIFYLAILAFCFTESVLTSQYTILLFMFFPLLSLWHKNPMVRTN